MNIATAAAIPGQRLRTIEPRRAEYQGSTGLTFPGLAVRSAAVG